MCVVFYAGYMAACVRVTVRDWNDIPLKVKVNIKTINFIEFTGTLLCFFFVDFNFSIVALEQRVV